MLDAELYDFADAFDAAYALRYDLEDKLNKEVLLQIYTDLMDHFDALTKNKSTLEKRLMIDLMATREAYNRGEIFEVNHFKVRR